MAATPVLTDLDFGGSARVKNLASPTDAGDAVRNDDPRLGGGLALPVGATIDSAAPVSFAGQTWLDHGVGFSDYLRATYPGLAALHPFGPPAEQMEPMNIPRGGFQAIAANSGPQPLSWSASSNAALGIVITPTVKNGKVYIATTAGVNGATEPTWPTVAGQTVTDGSTVWTCYDSVIVAATNSAATGNCICVSRDGGQTWRTFPAPAALTSITYAGAGSTWLACDGTTANIYRSTDDGQTWVRISTASLATQAVVSVAADCYGNAVAILGTASTVWLRSTDTGLTWASQATAIVGANGFACCLVEISGSSASASIFAAINSSGATFQLSASAGTATARSTATGMNQLEAFLSSTIVASAAAGTTTPLQAGVASWKTGGAFAAWTAAPAACRNFRYCSLAAGGHTLFGFANANAGTALYFWTGSAWTTLTVAAYGIGVSSANTADSRSVLASINTTAANTASNLTRFNSAGFNTSGGHAGIPHAGATSFAFGEVSGKMFACNTGASTIQQLMVHDGTGWRTQVAPNGLACLADRIFDLGNNIGVVCRGSNNVVRTANANAANPTWASVSVFANFLLHDAANTVTVMWDSGSGVRRSTDRMATFPTISSPTALTLAGFTFRGHGIVFDGAYWFPGNDVQGRAALAKSTDLGLTWSIESTELENSQFDFLATSGTEAVALCKASGVVWTRTIGGAWKQASEGSIAQGVGVWVDLLWCSGRGQYIALSSTNWSYSPLASSVDGERWEPCGNQITGALLGRLGYSPTLDKLFASTAAASNTPILSEIKTFDKANLFRLYQQRGKGQSVRTYSRAS